MAFILNLVCLSFMCLFYNRYLHGKFTHIMPLYIWLNISFKEHVTNVEVRAKIQLAIGPHEDLTIVKRRKLQWYGHVSR